MTILTQKNQGLLGLAAIASILSVSPSALAYNIVFGEIDTGETVRNNFIGSLDINSSSTVIDNGTDFVNNTPAAGSTTSVVRSGDIGGSLFNYTIYDVDFSNSPTGKINPGFEGDDINQLDNITVETPASQETAEGPAGVWGVDSASGQNSNSNALLLDFSGNSVGHFGIDLHDFEAGTGIDGLTSGASGEIRIYQENDTTGENELVFSYTLEFPGPTGGGSTDNPNNAEANDSAIPGFGNRQSMFVGVTANDSSEFFDQIVFVLGDDDVGNFDGDGNLITDKVNSGWTEQYAAGRFTFGEAHASAAVPFNFSPTFSRSKNHFGSGDRQIL